MLARLLWLIGVFFKRRVRSLFPSQRQQGRSTIGYQTLLFPIFLRKIRVVLIDISIFNQRFEAASGLVAENRHRSSDQCTNVLSSILSLPSFFDLDTGNDGSKSGVKFLL